MKHYPPEKGDSGKGLKKSDEKLGFYDGTGEQEKKRVAFVAKTQQRVKCGHQSSSLNMVFLSFLPFKSFKFSGSIKKLR